MAARPAASGRVIAPGSPAFELHTLGWRAFQDLCAAVLRQVWGQSVQAFADSNDAGRDGAFYGNWHVQPGGAGPQDLLEGPFVLQCKHTKWRTLAPSDLDGEMSKVATLVSRGLCRGYVLMTNARVSGRSEETIRRRLRGAGVEHPVILGGQWVCDTITAHRELRLFVPRVYGLGDLSQILDERVYAQASMLMASARDQVATFVVTDPYRRAAEALRSDGFVLLLGEPGVGKSVIALMLALAAADNWECVVVKARTASEVVEHWNPYEPNQLFWVDDAFGAVRHESYLSSDWARSLPHVMAAIGKGARVVLTARTYIYESARHLLKEYSYARLREQRVVVNAEDLSLDNRRQIVYNHIALGDQSVEVRRQMKPFLDQVASAEPFRPEVVRRLGLRAFTVGLALTEQGILDFTQRAREFLHNVFDQLGGDEHAALALVYAAAVDGSLANPLVLDERQRDIISRAGSNAAATAAALRALTGTFLRTGDGSVVEHGWRFRHPTLWEGFASWLSTQPHLLNVVLPGLTDSALLTRVDCQDGDSREQRGILLRVPPSLYTPMAERLCAIWVRVRDLEGDIFRWDEERETRFAYYDFLASHSSDAFLSVYLTIDPGLVERLLAFKSASEYHKAEPEVLARLHQGGLLTEQARRSAVERMKHLAVTAPDSGWLDGGAWKVLLTTEDRAQLMETVRGTLVPRLAQAVEEWFDIDFSREDDAVDNALVFYADAFREAGDEATAIAFEMAQNSYLELIDPPSDNDEYRRYSPPLTFRSTSDTDHASDRSIFDDID